MTSFPHAFHTHLNFHTHWRMGDLSSSNFNFKRADSICQYMALCTQELGACFLGGIMPELNNTALYKNEDLFCTFVLKVILITRQALGVGEVNMSQVLAWASTLDRLWIIRHILF